MLSTSIASQNSAVFTASQKQLAPVGYFAIGTVEKSCLMVKSPGPFPMSIYIIFEHGDFMMAAEQKLLSLVQEKNIEQLTATDRMKDIIAAVNELIIGDFNQLIHILYRVDVSENQLKKWLHEHPGTDAAELIANLLVERQVQKIRIRETLKTDSSDIPENEKW